MGPAGSRRREGEGSTEAVTDAADAGSEAATGAATDAATDTGSEAVGAAADADTGGGSGACGACAPDGEGHRARCPVAALRVPAHSGPFGRDCARLVRWLLPRERQG